MPEPLPPACPVISAPRAPPGAGCAPCATRSSSHSWRRAPCTAAPSALPRTAARPVQDAASLRSHARRCVQVNDGSCLSGIQVVVASDSPAFAEARPRPCHCAAARSAAAARAPTFWAPRRAQSRCVTAV